MGRLGPLGSAAFRAFWGARAVSLFGDRIAAVALVLAVYQREGSGVAVGLLLLAEVAPQCLGPDLRARERLAASRADRPRSHAPTTSASRAKKARLRSVLIPQLTGTFW